MSNSSNSVIDYSEVVIFEDMNRIKPDFEIDMCHYSQLSYREPSEIDSSENKFLFIDVEDTQCYIWEYNNTLVISFRGTESFGDVVTDLRMVTDIFCDNFIMSDKQCPKIHRGFKRQFENVVKQIDEKIKSFSGNSENCMKPIYFTGHSLGGGLATIAALYFSFLINNPIACVTFGSPRAGDNSFAELFNSRIKHSIRFVNQEDPIPFMPPDLFYEHVGGIRYIDCHECIHDSITENRVCNFIRDCMCCCCGKERPSHDHRCGDYYSAIVKFKHQKTI